MKAQRRPETGGLDTGHWVAAGGLAQGEMEDALYAAAEPNGLSVGDGQRPCWGQHPQRLGAGLQQPVDLDADDRPPAQNRRRATRGSSRSH